MVETKQYRIVQRKDGTLAVHEVFAARPGHGLRVAKTPAVFVTTEVVGASHAIVIMLSQAMIGAHTDSPLDEYELDACGWIVQA